MRIDGLSIFYREAGPKDAPTILLLHGLPSSSRMFQPLLTRLADNYHLVAPDYPGYGHSDWPDPKGFDYTFDHIASVMDDFTQALGLSHYTLYMESGKNRGLRRLGIACFVHSWVPTRQRGAPVLVQNAGPYLQ